VLTVDALRRIVEANVAVAVNRYSPGRDRATEFRSGRAAARAALASLGVDAGELPEGPAGPVWPDGIVGSISHSAGTAVAIAARSVAHTALGIDIEREDRVIDDRVLARIATQVEQEWLSSSGGLERLMLFCAKEATYKALARFVPGRVSFSDVEFRPPEDGRLAGQMPSSVSRYTPASMVTARTLISGGFVIAVVHVEAAVNRR
jgi:4'-phosphopantetheinyl transferase EntD